MGEGLKKAPPPLGRDRLKRWFEFQLKTNFILVLCSKIVIYCDDGSDSYFPSWQRHSYLVWYIDKVRHGGQ